MLVVFPLWRADPVNKMTLIHLRFRISSSFTCRMSRLMEESRRCRGTEMAEPHATIR